MSNDDRLTRKFRLREAEGYLELALLCSSGSGLPDAGAPSGDRLAERALKSLEPLLPHRNRRAHVLFLKGQAHQILRQYRPALEALRQSRELDPERIDVYLSLGWCYKRIGQLDQAISSLEEALTVDGEAAIVHYNLACYWALTGDGKQAAAYVGTAVEIEPAYRSMIATEPDFDLVRSDPAFRAALTVSA